MLFPGYPHDPFITSFRSLLKCHLLAQVFLERSKTAAVTLALPILLALCFSIALPSAAAKSLQSYLTLCDPTDGSPPGFPVPGILIIFYIKYRRFSTSRIESITTFYLFK